MSSRRWDNYRSWWLDGRADHGRWVTSWKLWLCLLPLSWVSIFVNVFAGDMRVAVRATIVGCLVSGLVLWLASVTILRHRRTKIVTFGWMASIWFIVGVTMYLSAMFAVGLSNSESVTLTGNVLAIAARFGMTYILTRAVAVAILWYFAAGRRRATELAATREELQLTLSEVEAYVLAAKERYVAFVASSVRPRIRQIQLDLAETVGAGIDQQSLDSLVVRFDHLTTEEVRPLSHSLASDGVVGAGTPSNAPRAIEPEIDMARASFFSYLPPTAPVAVLMLSVLGAWLLAKPQIGVFPLSTLAVFWPIGIIAVSRLISRRWRERNNVVPAWFVMSVLAVIVGGVFFIAAIAFRVETVIPFPSLNEPQTAIYRAVVVPSTIVVLTAAGWLITYLVHRQQLLDASLLRANAQLEQIILSREIESEQVRQTLAHLVHGPIQGRLALATMILRRLRIQDHDAESDNDAADSVGIEQVEELLELIEADLDRLPGLIETRSLTGYLTTAAREMRGLSVLTWTESQDCARILESNLSLERRLTILVEEVVGNAFRHGRAEHIHVWFDLAQSHPLTVEITVTNDGSGVPSTPTAGLGEQMFNALSESWELTSDPAAGTVFRALVADRNALHSYA